MWSPAQLSPTALSFASKRTLDGSISALNASCRGVPAGTRSPPATTVPEPVLRASTRAAEPVDGRSLDLGLPDKESEYPGWLAAGGERLAAVLHEAGPDTAAWAWGPDQTSGFWARRMLHETVVHRADAEIATGKVPEIDAVTAADAIDEFLANLPAMLVMRNRELPAGESLHLHATDGDGEWLIRFTADGIETSRDHAKATTALRAPTDRLLLFTYGRIKPDDESLTVFGDEALAATWQEKTAL